MKYRIVRQFGMHIAQQETRVYRVETVDAMTEKEALALMRELNGDAEPPAT